MVKTPFNSTSVDDDGNRTTKISFSDESEDEQRGHFDWDIYQSKRTPLKLGDVSCTICAKQLLGMPTIHRLIEKQLGYDWGATCVEDWIENDHAVEKDKRIVSQHFIDGESVLSSLKQIVVLQRLCSDMNINLFTLKAYLLYVDRLFLLGYDK